MIVEDYINELYSFSDGICSIAIIESWLLKYQVEYASIKEEESKRFMYFIDGNWVRLPDYFDSRTPEEKFLHLYDTLETITEFHKEEKYFKQEMAIYKSLKNNPDKVLRWLTKNEHLGANTYFMFSLDDFEGVNLDRIDFKFTLEFIETFDSIYWELLEELELDKLI